MKKLSIIALATSFVIASCSKKDDQDNPSPPSARIMFINTTVGADSVRAEVGTQTVVNAIPLLASSGYQGIAPGDNQTIRFRQAASNLVLGSTSATLSADNYYSVFSTGTIQNKDLLFTTDDRTAPAANRVKLRFINASSQSFPATVTIQYAGSTTTLATGVTYQNITSFTEVDAGSVSINAINPADFSVVGLTGVQLGAGQIYTVMLSGIPGGVGKNNLQLTVISNN